MGISSDREIARLVCGLSQEFFSTFSPSLEEACQTKLFTQTQCLEFIGSKVRIARKPGAARRPPADEARDALADLVLAHVAVNGLNFRPKAIFLGRMDQTFVHRVSSLFTLFIFATQPSWFAA